MRDRGEEEVGRLGEGGLVVEEWTEPADGEKEVFFRNLFSTFQEPGYKGGLGGLWKMVQVMVVMWGLDNFVVLVDCEGWKGGWRGVVESGITYGVMGGMNFVGRAVGCRAVNEEYTPARLVGRGEGRKDE